MDGSCLICGNALTGEDSVTVTKGRTTLIEASLKRNDGLSEKFETISPLQVHVSCRKGYTRRSSIEASMAPSDSLSPEIPETVSQNLRSSSDLFNFKVDCLFCGEEASTKFFV